ncbi:MAG TPA: head-tail connector protein [Gemmata sp.]
MGYGLVTTVGPALEPVTLAEAKKHLTVGHSDDDTLIGRFICAAREQTETETGRRWMPQTLTMSFGEFPRRSEEVAGVCVPVIRLPVDPVSAVNAVRYYDAAGVLQTLTAGTHYLAWLAHSPPLVYPAPGQVWPQTQLGRFGAVEVEFVAGYANANVVPSAAKVAMLLAVGLWYENRGDSEDPTELGLPPAALRLLRSLSTGHYS